MNHSDTAAPIYLAHTIHVLPSGQLTGRNPSPGIWLSVICVINVSFAINMLALRTDSFCVCVYVQEKVDTLRLLGAEVRQVPAVAWSDDNNYNHQVYTLYIQT